MNTIEMNNITHRFHRHETVLDNVALHVPEGSIYGFLGPNGAGKTTTLRLLLGLLNQQSGAISIFGKPFQQHRTAILQQIGALIESPSLYGHLTARENLLIWQKVFWCPPSRIDAVLRLTGIADTGKKNVGQFSLGMKQRLGIAIALLHQPRLLVLDEPTNGLDPNGMIEMREMLRHINQQEGVTILISSHLLGEMEKLVSHIGIIHKGQMRFEGTLPQLLDQRRSQSRTILQTGNNTQALDLVRAIIPTAQVEQGHILLPKLDHTTISQLNRELVLADVPVYSIHTQEMALEEAFMGTLSDSTHN
jgi:lantibiotic transport system ATP-binding protein